MKSTQQRWLLAVAILAISASSWAQSPASTVAAPVTAAEFQALQQTVLAQQKQIQQLSTQLTLLLQKLQPDGSPQSAPAGAVSSGTTQAPVSLQPSEAELKHAVLAQGESAGTAAENTQQVTPSSELESPLTIRFRGLSITPSGFVAAETVRRSRALGADVSTPFNVIGMPGAAQSSIPEFVGSARQTRPTVYFLGHLKNAELSSYISGDFLSAGTSSTSTQSNGYTFRIRQAWGQARLDNGWSFLGGQMWSLVTENLMGIRPSDDTGKTNDARPKTIDSAYNVGFSYARQFGVRVTKDFGDKIWVAVAVENPQATLTTHNNGNNFLLGQSGDTRSNNSLASYAFNPSPDVIAKLAFDPGFGHYELFAIYDRFTDRVYPCGEVKAGTLCGGSTTPGVNALGAYNATTNGSGFGANARWRFDHNRIVVGLHGFGGNGVGRYGTGQLPDLTINADGTPRLIKGYQGLGTLEWRGKKLDVYLYGGAEYASRTFEFDSISGQQVGYGAPAFVNSGCFVENPPSVNTGFTPGALTNCAGDTRVLIEGTGGFWYRFYSGPVGRVQLGTQYSYVVRNTWSGIGGEPHGVENMLFTSFRYYLP